MTYRQLVAGHIQSLADSGLSRAQIANTLGVGAPNYISMLMNPEQAHALALKRLPALARACRLDAIDSLKLVLALARDIGDGASQFDVETLKWIIKCTLEAGRSKGVTHAVPSSTGAALGR